MRGGKKQEGFGNQAKPDEDENAAREVGGGILLNGALRVDPLMDKESHHDQSCSGKKTVEIQPPQRRSEDELVRRGEYDPDPGERKLQLQTPGGGRENDEEGDLPEARKAVDPGAGIRLAGIEQ